MPPQKKKTINRAPLWLASHKKKKVVETPSPIKKPPPQREWSPIAGLYTPPESPVKVVKETVVVLKRKSPPRPKTPPPKQPTPPPTPPDPHVRELELMASLRPRAYSERAEGDICVYREAAQASPLKAQQLPRLRPTPTPYHSEAEAGAQLDRMYDAVVSPAKARADVGEAAMLAFADAQKTYEAPAPAPAPKTPVVAEAPAPRRGHASRGMVFHRNIHTKGLTVSYDEDASFLALMRGAAAASPAPRRRKRPSRKRRSRDRAPLLDPGLDAILRETAASPQKPPRGSFDSNDSLASFVSTTRSAAPRRSSRLRTVV